MAEETTTEQVEQVQQPQQQQQQQQQFLVPLDTYLKAGLHIGTKFRTKYMAPFIYKIRPDGLAVLNIQEINKRIELVTKFVAKFSPSEILVVGKRENGWKAINAFSKVTGVRNYAGNYHAGVLTNIQLEEFTEIKVLICTDPWPDKDAVRDAVKSGATVIALCDTNNESNYIDIVVPCNNKGKKSLGLFFWILAKQYMKNRGLIKSDEELSAKIEDFIEE